MSTQHIMNVCNVAWCNMKAYTSVLPRDRGQLNIEEGVKEPGLF